MKNWHFIHSIQSPVTDSLVSLLHMLISELYHWKGISLFYCIGVGNVGYDLSIIESSYSMARLQSREKLSEFIPSLSRNFFQI